MLIIHKTISIDVSVKAESVSEAHEYFDAITRKAVEAVTTGGYLRRKKHVELLSVHGEHGEVK